MTDGGDRREARDARDAGALPHAPVTAGELKTLRDAVADAAAVCAGLWFSYLLVLFYLLVGAAGVTQRDLLLSDVVTLPFLSGVQLPLRGFAALGPALFVVTHAYVMVHLALLATKVAAFDGALARIDSPAVRNQMREELPLNIFVQLFAGPDDVQGGPMAMLLGLAASISLVIGPIGLLVFFVLQFLPSHDEGVTWLQRLLVLADLILLWLLGPPIVSRTRRGPRGWTVASAAAVVAMVLVSAAALQIVFAAATFRGEWLNTVMARAPWHGPGWGRQRLWSDYVTLDHADLSSDARPGAGPLASLKGRDLERAVLQNTIMQRFDLMGADLRGANLNYAQLQGSNLNGARLEGASLVGAKLHGATLDHAFLAGANLASAQLQGANLANADLHGTNLEHAQLQGAILDGASLEGAILDSAQLQGASLDKTKLHGASLQKAFVWRANPATAEAERARIGALITEPVQPCEAPDGCPWADPVGDLKTLIARHESDDDIDPIVKRLQGQFALPKKGDHDALLQRSWRTLEDKVQAEDFASAQALAWSTAGCATTAAPFVAVQMTRTLMARRTQDGAALASLAGRLLDPGCAGGLGIPARTRADLIGLRDGAPIDGGFD